MHKRKLVVKQRLVPPLVLALFEICAEAEELDEDEVCICHACTMHMLCRGHAEAMHIPCICDAEAEELDEDDVCIYHACTMHMPCICHAEAEELDEDEVSSG